MSNTSHQDLPNQTFRLNKFLALSLGVSRRQADEIIEARQVIVNNQLARLGQIISSDDRIIYRNKELSVQKHQLLILNKPTGYLCSRASQGGVPTIYKLIPDNLNHLKPVGRLDKDSSGLILMTNDGDLAHQMTHPSFSKLKRYLATLDKPLEPLHQQMINDYGVQLPDGNSKLTLERQHERDNSQWIIQMREGRNRQIRRTFQTLGYEVIKLHRTDFGDYALGDIKRGEYRLIDIP